MNNDDDSIKLSYIFQSFWLKIDTNNLHIIIDDILSRRDIDKELKEKFVIWIHTKFDLTNFRDLKVSELYKLISDTSINRILNNLNSDITEHNLLCPICSNALTNPITDDCGHVFCEDCLKKHSRIPIIQNEPVLCPTCRQPMKNTHRIYI